MKATNPHTIPTWKSFARRLTCGACAWLLGSLLSAPAATDVAGTIVEETWTKTNSPYRVVGNILVGGLVIEPGVEVLFQGDYVFEVAGILLADGTAEEPISFTRTTGGWQGIFFNYSSPGSALSWCMISNSVYCGVRIVNSVPVLDHCWFVGNTSPGSGGGVYASMPVGDLVLEECTFLNNRSAAHGGGLCAGLSGGTVRLSGGTFSGNIANPSDSVGGYVGGAICIWGATDMANCRLLNNTAYARNDGDITGRGGAAYFAGPTTVVNCEFRGNLARANETYWASRSAWAYGGAIYLENGSLLLKNSIMAYNSVVAYADRPYRAGAGVFVNSGNCTVVNSTFAYNDAEGIYRNGGSVTVLNSIAYFNSVAQIGGSPAVTYSDVQHGYGGTGNIDFNPIFQSTSNLKIVAGSRCIDAGHPDSAFNDLCRPPSLGGVRNDMGAHGGPGACGWTPGEAPSIVEASPGQSACAGRDVTFCVTAAGSPPLHYQWHLNGVPLPDRTAACLTLTNVQATDAGQYSVTVSNVFEIASSAASALVVFDPCLELRMYAGLTIAGRPGATCVVSCTTDLNNPNSWMPLATNTLTSADWFFLDLDTPFLPRRFYKATVQP